MKDSHSRSLAKGVSWRILGTIDTIVIAWFITGQAIKALSIGGIEVITKVILYYLHERVWQRVPWGKPQPATAPVADNAPSPTPPQTTPAQHLYPTNHQLLSRAEREKYLGQHSKVIWLTGLSGSGKTTLAAALERKLLENGRFAQVLDGDNIRGGLNNNLGFSLEDRQENIRRVAELAKLYCHSGIIPICTFISPTREIRQFARDIIDEQDFLEVYVNAPLQVCESRDVKGLYQKARRGEIKDFTGIDAPYEPPLQPDLELNTAELSVEQALELLVRAVEDFANKKIAPPSHD
jgi:adenylylsulfate kinase